MSLTRPRFPKPRNAMVVTDFPIKTEVEQDKPYCSASNMTLMGDLHRVGIKQKGCFYTYFSYERPTKDSYDFVNDFAKHKNLEPVGSDLGIAGQIFHQLETVKDLWVSETLWLEFQGLLAAIREVKPKIIIVTGKWSLFFLTTCTTYAKTQGTWKDAKPQGGLNKFRASILRIDETFGAGFKDIIVFPMLPVTTKMRSPEKAPVLAWDMKKAGAIYQDLINGESEKYLEPKTDFNFEQDFNKIVGYLRGLTKGLTIAPSLVSVDIETRHSTIDCIGITPKTGAGICIAFSTLENPLLFSAKQELEIVMLIRELLPMENCRVIGQNFSYDAQYLYKFWLIDVHSYFDTMVAHHVLYNYMPKSLDFLASVYCDQYKYWKDMQSHGK